ncbi:MAG TPA: hypothetical protein VNJ04_19700 [Gemmatimonadaceae bacterium]|nr:hypothetical protein [Gemmatimonadaceae bacterium]
MIAWLYRLFHPAEVESGQTEEVQEALGTARRVREEIDERISDRNHEVDAIKIEQTRIRRDLILAAPLIRKNEDMPGTMMRKP